MSLLSLPVRTSKMSVKKELLGSRTSVTAMSLFFNGDTGRAHELLARQEVGSEWGCSTFG
jgi:hypothetical protein